MEEPFAFVAAGLLVLTAVWTPVLFRGAPLTLPMLAVGIGALAAAAGLRLPDADSMLPAARLLLEFVLVAAVMGSGLRSDRPLRPRPWAAPLRLVFLAMPLSIAGIAALAVGLDGFSLAEGILLGAILAPTDPVLASQVGAPPPGEGESDPARFALTSEAGMNDGVALPFVLLGLDLVMSPEAVRPESLATWLGVELVWKTLGGAVVGSMVGFALVRGNERLPEGVRLAASGHGIAIIGVMALVYGLANLLSLNGLVAVFACGVSIRSSTREGEFMRRTHHFAEQVEHILMASILILFGAVLAGGLLSSLRLGEVVIAVMVLAIVRPVAVFLTFVKSQASKAQRLAFGMFGIRGLGSLFYAVVAMISLGGGHDALWRIVGLTVLLSIVLHGATAGPVLRKLGV